MWSRRSARAAAMAASRTSTISAGSWQRCSRARRPRRCSRATTTSASAAPTRTSPTPSRATNFMTPKSAMEKMLRDEVLDLAGEMPFARKLVNSGRLSVPCSLAGLPLADAVAGRRAGAGLALQGCAAQKQNGEDVWLLNQLGDGFTLLSFGDGAAHRDRRYRAHPRGAAGRGRAAGRRRPCVRALRRGITYLIRPDQHVAAAFRAPDAAAVRAARDRALARP